jgi:hypothetical protein
MLMIRHRYLLLTLVPLLLALSLSTGFAETSQHLQLLMIGNGQGPYYAPAGQSSELKMEILNVARDDIYLTRGEVYLDPNLSGTSQLIHSEDLGNFHLSYLSSAVWTFDLTMPQNVQAQNATSGVPQVVVSIQIVYSTANGLQQTQQGQFALSVPGANVRQPDYSIWFVGMGMICVIALFIAARRHVSKRIERDNSM